jgi:phosphatidylinositol-3-phosphatase
MRRNAAYRLSRLGAAASVAAIGTALATAPVAAGTSGLCGSKTGSRSSIYRHVVVIMDENQSFSDIIGPRGSAARRRAPFLNHLARTCGLASNYRGVTHPSHPNYMAITGGIPAIGSSEGPNIFRQVRRSGEEWRSYNPTMPHPCQRTAKYPYKPGHNPGIAWLRIAEDCRRWDVNGRALARDIARHSLPAYAFITPDQCHNMHASCKPRKGAVRAGDDWLRKWIRRLADLPSYTDGRTVIFITWDEGSHGQGADKRGEHCLAPVHRHDESCHVATIVLSAHTRPGTRSQHFFSHYSLLHTAERLLGYRRYIGHADDPLTTGMSRAFGL